ncbi:MAG TPA: dipeptide epimerase [Bacteroidia bacterium]|nr:dipeptide epimerase [Bacteroidia bacterium]
MKLSYAPYFLEFKHPFGLSHGTRTKTDVVYVKLEKDDKIGYGEAALPPYLGETQTSVTAFFKKAAPVLENTNLPLAEIIQTIDKISYGNTAAKAALDIALYDLSGKIQNKPVYELLGLEKPAPKETSVTIAIGDLSLIPGKLKELSDFKLLKIKLGNANDKEIISCIRKHTDKPLVADINQGWTDKYFALDMIHWLAEQNVLFTEQPLPKENYKDMSWLTEKSPLPILADESFQRLDDLEKISECFSGINLKLMKCAGLYEGVKIISAAKKKKLKINIGCMSESSCGIAAAAQLMHYADWVDLDGPMLIKNNAFSGINFIDGKLELNNSPGTGALLQNSGISFQLCQG